MPPKVGKCPSCGQTTSLKSSQCLYCGAQLDEMAVQNAATPGSSGGHEEPRALGGKARFSKQSDDRVHYLVLDSGEPVEVPPGKLFVIGRDPHANLIVRAPSVSRQHAEIDWRGDPPRPMLAEVRSRFGTYLNGRIIARGATEPLRDGDEIRLGPQFAVVYRNVEPKRLRDELNMSGRDETREMRLPRPQHDSGPYPTSPPQIPQPAIAPRGATTFFGGRAQDEGGGLLASMIGDGALEIPFEGDLAQLPARVVLETLHRRRASGVVTIFDGGGTGEIVLAEGRATKAVYGNSSGLLALEHMSRATMGAYRFRAEQSPLMGSGAAPIVGATQLYGSPSPLGGSLGMGGLPGLAPPSHPSIRLGQPSEFGGGIGDNLERATTPSGGIKLPPMRDTRPMSPPPPPGPGSPFRDVNEPPRTQTGGVVPIRGASPTPPAQERPHPPAIKTDSGRMPAVGASPLRRPPTSQAIQVRTESGDYAGSLPNTEAPSAREPALAPPPTGAIIPVPSLAAPDGQTRPKQRIDQAIATVLAAGLTGAELGSFVGEIALELLGEGDLPASIGVCERALITVESSGSGGPAVRTALLAMLDRPDRHARMLEILERDMARRGHGWTAPLAQRIVKLLGKNDGNTTMVPDSALSKIAAMSVGAPPAAPQAT